MGPDSVFVIAGIGQCPVFSAYGIVADSEFFAAARHVAETCCRIKGDRSLIGDGDECSQIVCPRIIDTYKYDQFASRINDDTSFLPLVEDMVRISGEPGGIARECVREGPVGRTHRVGTDRYGEYGYSHFAVGRGCSHGVPNASLILDERGWGSVIIAFEKGCQG